ncbi:MAG: DUF697 domain-containing protein [Gomphosphaeria aponina SAG 52.96 = DSM 107014]|uniref:DUF697 domain-containing protein n=1 Tax=Gomphosphaeria aponina SAG 52.96 = DSM 107014 TaxID=1521640 RepID=A0A941GU72_9CHRO|nr:DUF697 domain-containing protein [Gomphosphaeria aponina SAG 52.96 = DSM 107014]
MTVKLRKPILLGGISLSFGLWLWQNFGQSILEVGELSVVGAIALGTGWWYVQQKLSKPQLSPTVLLPLNQEKVAKAIALAQNTITSLEIEAPAQDCCGLKQQLAALPALCKRQTLQIAVTGGKKVGKTTLIQLLENAANICLVETPALFTATDTQEKTALKLATAADLVLFMVTGDLTESEWQVLQQLVAEHQQIILILNKQDQYVPEERAVIWQQLKSRVKEIIPAANIVAIAAAPTGVKVRQHQIDGATKEWMEKQGSELGNLGDRLSEILTKEKEQLLLGTTWRTAIKLEQEAKNILNAVRKVRALPMIEKYQWLAAISTFANPVAALDLLATAAINTQMLVDLSGIYQQKLSLSQGQTGSVTIAKLMVQLGLVELSTQTIGSILKTNAITYVAGATVQGVSAAYLTRIAGLSLIEYFQEQETCTEGFNLEKLGAKLQKVFQENQRTAFLQGFIQQALTKLTPNKNIMVDG